MTINTTIIDTGPAPERTHSADSTDSAETASAPRTKLPGWLWFIALWCFGVGSAVSLGYVFKLLMNTTLFAVT